MKSILLAIVATIAALIAPSCARFGNDLYFYNEDPALSLLFLVNGGADPGTPPSAIYLFNAGQPTGALGGRSGADTLCASAVATAGLPITPVKVKAFLSVSASDQARDLLPSAWWSVAIPIMDPTGTNTVAGSWNDLLDGSINMTMGAAGIIPSGYWMWSGSESDGTFTAGGNSCNGWTSATSGVFGWAGASNSAGVNWIALGSQGCSASCYLLCLAY